MTVGVVIVDVNDVVVDDVIVDVFAVAVGCGGDVGTAIDAAGAVGDGDVCPTLDDGHYYLVSSFVDLNCEINLVKRKKGIHLFIQFNLPETFNIFSIVKIKKNKITKIKLPKKTNLFQ